MHFPTGWFIRNPVAANLLMLLILFLGFLTTQTIRIEGFPRVPPESAVITTVYPDATAEQVDQLISRKLENALQGLEGVRSISARSVNGMSIVEVRRAGGQKLDKLLDRIRLRVDGITDLPRNSRKPVIETTGFDLPALYLNLYGDTDTTTLQTLAERLREELLAEPELSRLNVWGLHGREMLIAVEPAILQQFGLTIEDVVGQIQASSLTFQAGTLRTLGGNIYLRADDHASYVSEFASIPVIERNDGSVVTLDDISSIRDTVSDGDYLFRFNGQATAGMEILVGQKENLLHISKVVREVVEQFRSRLPANVEIAVWGDASSYISDRLKLLQTNGFQGLLLVTLLLSIFLNVKLAFWVAMGIPVSVMGAMAVAGSGWVDYSLNDVTTFGLIIALGILVDDAVVVGESVFEERKHNADPILGTEAGVSRVAVATVFGVLTTISAFFPMLLIDNPLGKVLAGFSGIVIFALVFSLIESKFILPAHLAALDIGSPPRFLLSRLWSKLQSVANRGLYAFRDSVYQPVLLFSVRHRYAVLILFVSGGLLGMGMIGLGKIRTVFFPEVPGQIITVNLEMDARAPYTLIRKNMETIERHGLALNTEVQTENSLESPPIRTLFLIINSARSAQLYAELTPVAERPGVPVTDLVRQWRERTGALEGTTELEFTGSESLAGGFRLKLLSRHEDQLRAASEKLQVFLKDLEGISNVRDSLAGGQPELQIRIRPEARNLGFSPETLASQIGYAFGGAEVQRVQRGGSELRVLVRNNASARDTVDDLMGSQLRSEQGHWIPLQSVATVSGSYVPGDRYRENGKTVNTVSASIDREKVSPEEVAQAVYEQLLPELERLYPGLKLEKSGELEEMGEIQGGMKKALLLAMVLIYVLMAVPLKSYWQPFVILAIVPFGFIGAAVGHLIMDLPLSILSFFGMLALTGVIVNDSLVLITRYNQERESGAEVDKALIGAGISRFQAIFLTTATTVIGLLPLLSETSEQARYLIPAAVSLAYGELFSTALMLLLVPVLLAITHDVQQFFGFSETQKARH